MGKSLFISLVLFWSVGADAGLYAVECSQEESDSIYEIVVESMIKQYQAVPESIDPHSCHHQCNDYSDGETMCFFHASAKYEVCSEEQGCEEKKFTGYVSPILRNVSPDGIYYDEIKPQQGHPEEEPEGLLI